MAELHILRAILAVERVMHDVARIWPGVEGASAHGQ